MKKEVIVFKKVVAPGEEVRLTERVKDNGVIEEMRIRFYPGVERELAVNVYASHKVNAREDLVSYNEGAENLITGDDDYFIYPVSVPVEYDDELVVYAKNKSAIYPYTLSVDVIVGYDGGEY